MELIDQLEQKLDALLAANAALREDNVRLRTEADRSAQELERERATRQVVAARLDGLLQKLDAAATAAGRADEHAQP